MSVKSRGGAWSSTAVVSGVMAALVFAATMVQVRTPITRGYVNLGDSMIFIASLIGGPWVGFVAGSVGSALADIVSGYGYYAPGTFIIKGLEGFIAGYLYNLLAGKASSKGWKAIVAGVALAVFAAIVGFGWVYTGKYGGSTAFSIAGRTVAFTVPGWAWAVIGAILAGVILYAGLSRDPRLGAAIIAWFIAGLWMVTGYFIYEATVVYSLGKLEGSNPLAAAAEIPANIIQAVAGVVLAAFIAGALSRSTGATSRQA